MSRLGREDLLHLSVARFLKIAAPSLLWHHCPNGGSRHPGDASLSITERMAQAILVLARNLDTVRDAVTVAATVIGTTLASRAIGAGIISFTALRAQIALTNVQLMATALQSGVAAGGITRLSVAGAAGAASMRGLSAAMAFFGGPVGLAITGLAAGVALLAVNSGRAAREARELADEVARQAREAGLAAEQTASLKGEITATQSWAASLTGEVHKLADAHFRAAAGAKAQAIETARLRLEEANQTLSETQEAYTRRRRNDQGRADFATTAGWTANVPLNINGGPAMYHPLGERVLTVTHATAQVDVYSSRVSVEAGKWYEGSAYLLAHRSQVKLFIRWVNAAGGYISSPETVWTTVGGGGNSTLADYTRLWLKAQAPAGAVAAVLMARKSTTQSGSDSWMWMARPMLAETSETATGPALYTVGSGRDVLDAVDARASLALSTSVDAVTRLGQAAFELILASGGNPAYIKALAGAGGSEIALAATELLLRNVVGDQIVTALKLVNGEAYFGAPVSVDISGRRLTIGPGFGVSSGLVMWFGPNTVAMSNMSRTNGYFALGTDGKVYYGNAELGSGGGGGGGAALNRAPIAGQISSSSWTTLASVTFNGRPATGWWDALVMSLTGSSTGFQDTDVEFRVIESGATSALASGSAQVPAGGVPGLISVDLLPTAPWAQTRPAGNLTLMLQARRSGGTGTAGLQSGIFQVTYTPGV